MRPVSFKFKVTCKYGVKGTMWKSGWHQGIDYGCPVGTAVYSPVSGTVVKEGRAWGRAFGSHQVVIRFRKGLRYYYVGLMHMKAERITVGQKVKAGQRVGTSGADGNVSGPHLHMEVQPLAYWQAGKSVDPAKVIDLSTFTPL